MRKLNISDLNNNIFDEFNKGWALLTAGSRDNLNTMTISWGQCGHLWHRNICSVCLCSPAAADEAGYYQPFDSLRSARCNRCCGLCGGRRVAESHHPRGLSAAA